MVAPATTRWTEPNRSTSATLALTAVCGCAVLAVVDPAAPGRYPSCPTQALLGIDCPACGTLRGLHALSRGHLTEVMSHNVLLIAAVPLGVVVWWRWVLAGLGRPARPVRIPPWALPVVVAVATVFTIARNLPVGGLLWLDSA